MRRFPADFDDLKHGIKDHAREVRRPRQNTAFSTAETQRLPVPAEDPTPPYNHVIHCLLLATRGDLYP
jgi:hypothetical protein